MEKYSSLYRMTSKVGFLTVFYASIERPLNAWDKQARSGRIRRLFDDDGIPALEIKGQNILSTFIVAPCLPYARLGIRLRYLIIIVRKIDRIFAFEVQILDDTKARRRFRFCNYQITVRRNVTCCNMPLVLQDGWNEVTVDLGKFTKKAYGTNFVECVRIKIYPNCLLRQVYFTATVVSYQRVLNIMRTTLGRNIPELYPYTKYSMEDLQLQLQINTSPLFEKPLDNHKKDITTHDGTKIPSVDVSSTLPALLASSTSPLLSTDGESSELVSIKTEELNEELEEIIEEFEGNENLNAIELLLDEDDLEYPPLEE